MVSSGQLAVPTGDEQHLFLEQIWLALKEDIQSPVQEEEERQNQVLL